MSSEKTQIPEQTAVTLREQTTLRAYKLWQERGCPIGSPEEDWLRAEQEIRLQAAQPTAESKDTETRSRAVSA
jgi:hypothetical protein